MPVNEVGVDPNSRHEVYPVPDAHPVGGVAGAVGDGTTFEPGVKVQATDSLEARGLQKASCRRDRLELSDRLPGS